MFLPHWGIGLYWDIQHPFKLCEDGGCWWRFLANLLESLYSGVSPLFLSLCIVLLGMVQRLNFGGLLGGEEICVLSCNFTISSKKKTLQLYCISNLRLHLVARCCCPLSFLASLRLLAPLFFRSSLHFVRPPSVPRKNGCSFVVSISF